MTQICNEFNTDFLRENLKKEIKSKLNELNSLLNSANKNIANAKNPYLKF